MNQPQIQPQEPESLYFCWGDSWNCTKPYFNAETDVLIPEAAAYFLEEQSNQEDEE